MSKPAANWENLFTYDTLVHAVAGSVGSMTAMSVFYPLDTVRSRLQVEEHRASKDTLTMLKELVKDEGFESLYRGLHPVLVSLCASGFVYFYSFHGLRAVFSKDAKNHSAARDLFLGALAGTINVLSTTPLWVVNVRMKMQGAKLAKGDEGLKKYPHYHNIFHGLKLIRKNEGCKALWSSTLPSLMLVSNPALQFMVYENLKRKAMKFLETNQLSGSVIFALGAVAKSISTVLTYPIQVVQHKQRYGTAQQGFIEVLSSIIERHGVLGLYKGLEAKLLQTVLTTALMYLCYEKIAAFVFQIMKGKAKGQ